MQSDLRLSRRAQTLVDDLLPEILAGYFDGGADLARFARDQLAVSEPGNAAAMAEFVRARVDFALVRAGRPLRLVGLPRCEYGFAKVDLEDGGRLDVFRADMPRPSRPTGRHDHDFSFCSVVLGGALVDERYAAEFVGPGDPGYAEAPLDVYRAGFRQPAAPDGRRARLELTSRRSVLPGQAYRVPHDAVHEVDHVGPTLTLLRKTGTVDKEVTVFAGRGAAPFDGSVADVRRAIRLVHHTLALCGVRHSWRYC